MNATATRTRYILTTNGVDHGETYGSKARALKDAEAYVWAAERMERDASAHTHVIEIRTVATGKIVFSRTVEVPAKPVAAVSQPVVDAHGAVLTVGTTVRVAGLRDRSGMAPVLGFTPNRRVIVDFPNDGILGSYDYRGDCLIVVAPETAAKRFSGVSAAIFLSAVRIARTTPNAKSITGTLPEMPVLDTVKINTGDTKCGWCDETATHSVLIAGMSHEDFSCKRHFAEYYPHLNNAQRQSALCPLVDTGCDHTMAQNSEGYGIACVEYADAHGIAWREAA